MQRQNLSLLSEYKNGVLVVKLGQSHGEKMLKISTIRLNSHLSYLKYVVTHGLLILLIIDNVGQQESIC